MYSPGIAPIGLRYSTYKTEVVAPTIPCFQQSRPSAYIEENLNLDKGAFPIEFPLKESHHSTPNLGSQAVFKMQLITKYGLSSTKCH